MKKFLSIILSAILFGGLFSACQNEDNFLSEGEGFLKMKMVVNNSLTRSNADSLAKKCVIYISNTKGLIHKYKGLDNVPAQLALKSGNYVAEAWTGDSVTASFDKKFYRAYEPFEITKGNVKNVVLNCKIANVVVSVKPDAVVNDVLKDYKVTVANTRGSLDFTTENVDTARGYFMMPTGDTSLTWTVTGQKEDGSEFTKSGIIENVERAHEYVLNINYTPSHVDVGGAFISVKVDDSEIMVEDEVELTSAPIISGIGYDIDEALEGAPAKFERHSVFVQALGGLQSMKMSTTDYVALGIPNSEYDFTLIMDEAKTTLENAGVSYESNYDAEVETTYARVSFSADVLNRLPEGDYEIVFSATDSYGKSSSKTLHIKVSDASVTLIETPWSEVYAHRATLHGRVVKDGVSNPGFQYRAVGTSDWTSVNVANVGAGTEIIAELTGLQPGTRYEYQAIADGFVNTESMFFTTESIYAIPNASFEDWCNGGVKDALMANKSADNIFWDSGNQGASIANVNLASNSTELVHSGTYSAKLASNWCGMFGMGAFSGGNIFSGVCTEVVVSANPTAKLTFGQPYNGSRPAKLRGWANYRPGVIDYCETDKVKNGDTDQGQVYVALTSGNIYINPGEAKYFDSNSSTVLAFGEIVWTGNFAEDGQLQQFEINIEYKNEAKNIKPSHIIIQATASRYADYFTGSTSSVLYLDDLELVYE